MQTNCEIIGIIGTIAILIGFLSNSEKTIRIFDMIGAAFFVLYGALLHAWSNILLNTILIIIHIVKLAKRKGR